MVPMRNRFSEGEFLFERILQADRLVTVLEQEVELAEDLGQVSPIDLVDDQLKRHRPAHTVGLLGPEPLETVPAG
jgi:hypothetical protein